MVLKADLKDKESARLRYDRGLCYYHLLNRVAGTRSFLPFGDAEKEQFFRLALELSKLYCLELISVVVMSNHYHIVCAAPAAEPEGESAAVQGSDVGPRGRPHCRGDAGEIKRRWRAYYGDKRIEPNWDDPEVVAAWRARMRDISKFIHDLQQRYTCWYNRTRPERRRGRLWADRYKNVILETGEAVWDCVRYVEMNPVRAGLCSNPAEYRFSTWGRFAGSGAHPFAESAARHLRPFLYTFFGDRAAGLTDREVLFEFQADMARVLTGESGGSSEEIAQAQQAARKGSGFVLTVRRRVRYWSDGAIIGSKLFVRTVGAELIGRERATRKQLARSRSAGGGNLAALYSWRFLRVDV
ncbi:MAG: hypothetical protein GXP31_11600 [Kiritimatiellaeota bacterium]|nr:hypothetical protein [Kiritimatiellota bacterium]